MDTRFEETFLADVVALEAASHGMQSRLAELAALREEDGLSETDAVADAAESLGLAEAIRDHLATPFLSIVDPPIDTITFTDAHGGMPEWRRDGTAAIVALTPATLHELGPVVERLRAAIDVDPERLSVALAVGLGGTGGCACGDDLPEDAPPGPLFERR